MTPRAHHQFWPARVPHAIEPPATALPDNLLVSARRFPHRPALVYLGHTTTYAELAVQVERLAAWLAERGVGKGDRVLVGLQNCPQLVVAHYAILSANAVVVPVNPMNKAAELKHLIEDSGAVLAITSADLSAEWLAGGMAAADLLITRLAEVLPGGRTDGAGLPAGWADWLSADIALPAGATAWADALACIAAPPVTTVGADDLALLPYTSGTTGHPKGCMHRHRSLQHNVFAGGLWGSGSHEDVVLGVVPMFHITGMVVVMHGTLAGGAALVLMPRWQREYAARLIKDHRVTRWTNIPTMVIDLLASPQVDSFDLSSMVYIGGGGAAMPQAVAERLWQRWGLRYMEGYGLTETAAPSHTNPYDAPKQQCLGVPYLSCDARVVDPDTLRELPVGESGEIIVHGPMVFDGYWRRPDATEAAFCQFEGRRFFRTGDIGYVDADGYFFMTDRLKRMINASGFKVWPSEVENLMHAHPGIAEACVIAAPDTYRGETVKAVVVRRAGHEALTEAQLRDWCRANMAAYKVPARIEFVDNLPKSGTGKVMWRALQERERG
ncbi:MULTISPECIES: long-chain-fatty-acid--CoA ligase [unclassified Roseateles]|uniref:long-chain-fatty-acid--CoA ligase n=1 Tax=unclassified Roseateles TaxID=2626991 RepID=UPI0006FA3851|nr:MULTISPECIES: long-chain-fatty-acid--CoA ligase [unclassified Roseateles]KQW45468.1 long-chain fatty acid--CoA ligase [Pelomonas sp. Root405]KRA72312.1 long-chain fatty acid--CoA ligase [Pelomonas sp. Root662]